MKHEKLCKKINKTNVLKKKQTNKQIWKNKQMKYAMWKWIILNKEETNSELASWNTDLQFPKSTRLFISFNPP